MFVLISNFNFKLCEYKKNKTDIGIRNFWFCNQIWKEKYYLVYYSTTFYLTDCNFFGTISYLNSTKALQKQQEKCQQKKKFWKSIKYRNLCILGSYQIQLYIDHNVSLYIVVYKNSIVCCHTFHSVNQACYICIL